ncbi:MAG: CooT family nickel-binding protein [Oscillospiraceae bacterium]|nr:CooT family nickel-binding protein [Oscillospiraceae bacterium]
MCLSTVYKNEKTEDTVIMRNVMEIRCDETSVTLTDLMERTVTVEGKLLSANLVEGYVIIQ